MDAYLFEGSAPVQIDPASVEMGGPWEGNAHRLVPLAWESHLVKRVHDFLAPLDSPILIDVGANTGSYALLPALLPNLYVWAFEPQREACDILERNIEFNHLEHQVAAFCQGLWCQRDTLELKFSGEQASGCATFGVPVRFGVAKTQAAEVFTLD